MARFNGTVLTAESIQKAREWFAENAIACMEEAKAGEWKVNDPDTYFAYCEQRAQDAMAGKFDCSVAFLQRAYFIQTGEDVALLP